MEADLLKQIWKEDSRRRAVKPITREDLMTSLQTRATEVRMRTARRLKREIQIYVTFLVILAVSLFIGHKLSWRAILGTLGMSLFIGLVVAVLAYKEHKFRTLPLMGSLRESVVTLLGEIDSTTRLYMIAYMICIVIPVTVLVPILFSKQGLTLWPIVALIGGIVFVVWGYYSGREYLERSFGRYRAELANCLTELDQA